MKFFLNYFFIFAIYSTVFAQKNVVKWNVSSVAFNNVYLTYERVIEKKFSVNLGVGYVPTSLLMVTGFVPDVKSGDFTRESPLKNMNMTGYSITPEFRFYTSLIKESPRGLYLAAYLRHSNYDLSYQNYAYNYKDEFDNNISKIANINFESSISSIGGGLMLGHQWIIGQHFSIDLWILGLGVNSSTFQLRATDSNRAMNDLYFMAGSTFSKDIEEYFSFLGDVKLKIDENGHFVETTTSRILPALRGLGFNVGVAF
jgi:hypothetical protein